MVLIQGFVAAVPTANRAAFIEHAALAAEVFREYGLLAAVECWGDDVPEGEVTSFPMAVQARDDETVVFSWYVWPSKEAHDAGMERAFADQRLSFETNPMPFDGQRMIFGTFEPLFELGAHQPGGYVDGYIAAVPRAGRETVCKFANHCDAIFAENGATWIMEGWELDVPRGKQTDFFRAVQAGPDEAVLFSWVQWPDKATRDAGSARMMEDPRFAEMEMPFDGKRLVYGGFVPVVEV